MKIALAQINPTIGDLRGNCRLIVDFAQRARDGGADLVVFPELSLTGYPPQDLLDSPVFVDEIEACVERLATDLPSDIGVVIGAPIRNEASSGRVLFNTAILLEGGRRVAVIRKMLLPTYNIYDERRYFEAATAIEPVEWRGVRLGIHVCEDMWNTALSIPAPESERPLYGVDPVQELADQGAEILINISASPFSIGKRAQREDMIEGIARHHGLPFAFVNQVGANAEFVHAGESCVHDAAGERVLTCASFEEDLLIWDMESKASVTTAGYSGSDSVIEEIRTALVYGIREYFRKSGVFTKALIGLSGGIDSAVVAALAVEALGPEGVVGVTMPSKFSTEGSVDDSRVLAENLGIEFHRIPILAAVDAMDEMLMEAFSDTQPDVTEENIQARMRGMTLMALSNKFGYLLLSTGNKSEVGVGYVTLYGDTNGGLAVLSDVYKTQVYALARHINERAGREIIPESTITKPPSAELRPGQKDSDSLPPYDVLDRILRLYIEEQVDLDEIEHRTGFDRELIEGILRRVDNSEFKRWQLAPGLRVTDKAFGSGRRMPLVMRRRRDLDFETAHEHAAPGTTIS